MKNKKKREKGNVVFWKDEKLVISSKILKEMRFNALHNGTDKFRYCFHKNENSLIHEMLFTNTKNAYFRPHCHDDDELQVVISGKMYVIFFDDKGNIIDKFKASNKKNRIYRINKGQWHMNLPISRTITIFEVKQGPFNQGSNHYPAWAPDGVEKKAVKKFLIRIRRRINEETTC
ncbi:MAG: WbuC family cupin fold metalloprotein [Lachnospiraceae bacterium]|nr:WbuC family cupin fold metalloprotein [Lachnospiraceae bacterium]